MQQKLGQLIFMTMLATGSVLVGVQPAQAHLGAAAGWGHTLTELGVWGIGVLLVLGGIFGLLWVRAAAVRRLRR